MKENYHFGDPKVDACVPLKQMLKNQSVVWNIIANKSYRWEQKFNKV
jgi:hypothetical protein